MMIRNILTFYLVFTCHLVQSFVSNHFLELLRLEDLVHGFLHQSINPDTAVGRYEVHQTELSDDLIFVDVELAVHEEIVHLHEGEDHLQDGVDGGHNVPGAAVERSLEKMNKL